MLPPETETVALPSHTPLHEISLILIGNIAVLTGDGWLIGTTVELIHPVNE